MAAPAISIDDVRDKLLPLATVQEILAKTEPLSQVAFPLRGSRNETARFKLDEGWNAHVDGMKGTDTINATVKVGGVEYQLTRDALLEASSAIGLTKQYVSKTPAHLVEPNMNWWFQQKDGEMKLLATDEAVLAFTKGTITPFSNLRLIDAALESIRSVYGEQAEVLVDYKFQHDLRKTALRLIIPDYVRAPRADQPISAGVQIINSLIGERPLMESGYLFNYWCTNGAISTHAESGQWNRRTGGQGDEVYDWARAAVDDILTGLEGEFEALDELANTPIPNGEDGQPDVAGALRDLFETYGVPMHARQSIMDYMMNSTDMTMYEVMQAVTQAANDPNTPESARETLMRIGGDMPSAVTHRCDSCGRLPA